MNKFTTISHNTVKANAFTLQPSQVVEPQSRKNISQYHQYQTSQISLVSPDQKIFSFFLLFKLFKIFTRPNEFLPDSVWCSHIFCDHWSINVPCQGADLPSWPYLALITAFRWWYVSVPILMASLNEDAPEVQQFLSDHWSIERYKKYTSHLFLYLIYILNFVCRTFPFFYSAHIISREYYLKE